MTLIFQNFGSIGKGQTNTFFLGLMHFSLYRFLKLMTYRPLLVCWYHVAKLRNIFVWHILGIQISLSFSQLFSSAPQRCSHWQVSFSCHHLSKHSAFWHTVLLQCTCKISGFFPGGVLTLTWYTYMCLPFGAPFREIWYSDQGGFHQKRRSPNYINWVYFGQIIVKSTQFDPNWVLFSENGILMGGKFGKKLV